MAQDTKTGNSFASLFSTEEAASQEAEGTTQDETAQATESSEADSAKVETEDILDLLTKEDSEEEEIEWDGKQNLREHPRFKKLVEQRNEAREAKKETEARLTELESANELFTEHYSQFEDPQQQFQLDTQFVKAMDTLYSKNIDVVKQTAEMVHEFIRTGKIIDKKETVMPKSETKMNTDNTVARELWTDRVDTLLDSTPIKPELKTVIRKHAVSEFDGKSLSKTRAKEVISEFIKENEWSASFLTGKTSKAASKPSTASSTRRTEAPAKPQETSSKVEEATAEDLKADMNERMRQGFAKLMTTQS